MTSEPRLPLRISMKIVRVLSRKFLIFIWLETRWMSGLSLRHSTGLRIASWHRIYFLVCLRAYVSCQKKSIGWDITRKKISGKNSSEMGRYKEELFVDAEYKRMDDTRRGQENLEADAWRGQGQVRDTWRGQGQVRDTWRGQGQVRDTWRGQGQVRETWRGQGQVRDAASLKNRKKKRKKVFVLIPRADVSNADKALKSLSTLWVQTRAAQGQLTVRDWRGVKS